jgi:hypothetical protein
MASFYIIINEIKNENLIAAIKNIMLNRFLVVLLFFWKIQK